MEKFISEDKTVTKYIHKDCSETAIKHLQSCQQMIDLTTKSLKNVLNERNKYTVFISTTRGCFMECKFCHLTMKSCSYKMLSAEQVLSNLKESIEETIERNPFLKKYYVKLSWMGMGMLF